MAEGEGGGAAKGLKKKAGPLTVGGWLLSVGGALGLYILIRRYQADRAAANAAAGGGTGAGVLTGGGIIPAGVGQVGSGTGAPFSSYSSWLQAAIAQMTSSGGIDSGQALDAITTWLGGGCVSSAGYQAISGIIGSTNIGLPPGWGTSIPALSVCPAPTSGGGGSNPPPAPPPAPSAPPVPPAQAPVLPSINAQLFPLKVLFGQYGPNDYTKVGTVNNGTYSGAGVIGGAPVYAGLFGGFVQDFNMATLPSGTDLYVPTTLVKQGYVPNLQPTAA